jgi:hypothetical protein
MDVREAIKREQRKLERQLAKLEHEWNGLRAAAKAWSNSASHQFAGTRSPYCRPPPGRRSGKPPRNAGPSFARKRKNWRLASVSTALLKPFGGKPISAALSPCALASVLTNAMLRTPAYKPARTLTAKRGIVFIEVSSSCWKMSSPMRETNAKR